MQPSPRDNAICSYYISGCPMADTEDIGPEEKTQDFRSGDGPMRGSMDVAALQEGTLGLKYTILCNLEGVTPGSTCTL